MSWFDLELKNKLNEVIDHINKQEEIAASIGDNRRITPNNGETPDFEKMFKLYGLNPKEYLNAHLIEDIQLAFEKKDNPVASLNFVDKFLEEKPHWKSYIENSNSKSSNCVEWLLEDLRKFTEKNARTTDKENLIKMIKVEGNGGLKDFEIGKYPVTQKQWVTIMGNNPSHFKGDDLPVENVSWNDCQEFLMKLNAKTGRTYRLPTEAEWEFAAKGGNLNNGFVYANSNDLNEVGWYCGNSGSKTHPVGLKKPNQLGLYDMSGNVWEWCNDWYDDYPSSPQTNPTGPESNPHRILRGGCWNSDAEACQTSYRYDHYSRLRSGYYGFRLAI